MKTITYQTDRKHSSVIQKYGCLFKSIGYFSKKDISVGERIWTDGDNIYYSSRTTQYVLPATRHNYVDDDKYNPVFGIVTDCTCKTITNRFVFANE